MTTPLGKDVLLLTGFRGEEAMSQPYNFELDLIAEVGCEVSFDRIVGQNVTVEMRLGREEKRYFHGLVKRFSQGPRDEAFVHFGAELVPKLWLLTKKVGTRIFQHLSVSEILREVLSGLDVIYALSGTYYPRDYCVQYRESDFEFVSRLMEEEGIYYFFQHGESSHQMVVTDARYQHPFIPGKSKAVYDEGIGGLRMDMRVTAWEKTQELRSGEYTLWDHCFELPGNHLEAKKRMIDSVTVGEVTHKLRVGGNDQLRIFDYPGGYAQRFGGIDRNGTPRPQNLQNIFTDSERIVRVRMEQEMAAILEIAGTSSCGNFVAGHQFTLERHFDADGQYLLTHVRHDARLENNYRSTQALELRYENRFTCVPITLPHRPQRVTRKPVIAGAQTATVVGPPGEQIFCDKYGRVKVQFHWDRQGRKDADSSCWLRVSGVWAGKGRGEIHIPLIGDEVVVTFLEGDPDRPIIVGSVYNAEMMPAVDLPAEKTKSVIRDRGANEIIMEGKGGEEFMHLKQAYGNEIKMDAKEKTIRLYCPTHNTELVMGRSIHWGTDSDLIEMIKGKQSGVVMGWKHTTVGGARTEMTGGSKAELNLLNKNTFVAGVNYQVIAGWDKRHSISGKKQKLSALEELIKSQEQYIEKLVAKVDKCNQKFNKYSAKATRYEIKSKKNSLSGKVFKWKADRSEQKYTKIFETADKRIDRYKKAQIISNKLNLD